MSLMASTLILNILLDRTFPRRNITIENLTISHSNLGTDIGGILFTYCEKVRVTKVKAKNFTGLAFSCEDSFNFKFEECEALNCNTGFDIHNELSTNQVNNGTLFDCLAWGNSSRGINVTGVNMTRIIGCRANGNNLGIRSTTPEIHISGCHSEFNKLDGIRLTGNSSRSTVIGNDCSSNGDVGISLLTSGDEPQENTITGNITALNGLYGIYVDSKNNNIVANNITVSSNTIGLLLTANADNSSITGNTFDSLAEGTTTGITINSGANNNVLSGNNFTDITTLISDSGTGTIIDGIASNYDNTAIPTADGQQLIQTGWGFIQGDAINRTLQKTVTFPIAFSDIPRVIINNIGYKATTDPTSPGDTGTLVSMTWDFGLYDTSASQAFIQVYRRSIDGTDPGVLATANRYMFSWIAIGKK